MADAFTHNFDIDLIEVKLKGECEFNDDGKASFKFNDPQIVPLEYLNWFYKLMKFCEETYHIDGVSGFIKIKVVKKE